MEGKSAESVLKFLKGEISFTEWLQEEDDEIVFGEDPEKDSEGEDENEIKDPTTNEQLTTLGTKDLQALLAENTILESQPVLTNEGLSKETGDITSAGTTMDSVTSATVTPKMTELLLLSSGATDATKRPASRTVDEFRSEIPSLKKKPRIRRKQSQLPKKFEHEMGHANLCCAHGEYEKAKNICMEIIRRVPKCPEPFQTLGLMYEESGDKEKAFQGALASMTGLKTVPNVFLNGQSIGGGTETKRLYESGQLQKMLKEINK